VSKARAQFFLWWVLKPLLFETWSGGASLRVPLSTVMKKPETTAN
jgi:hypothetical protein